MSLGIVKTLSSETKERLSRGQVPQSKVDRYYRLLDDRVARKFFSHPVIVDNKFTEWFEEGNFDKTDLRHFVVQFSVFSNLFIEAQLKKTINAPTIEAMHASKEILLNELGVVFRNPNPTKTQKEPCTDCSNSKTCADTESQLVETEGTVDGGTFRFAAAHFEWLLRMAPHLDLTFLDMGKRRNGTRSTLFFCDELCRIYGSEDPQVALGASFGVENWAAAGFWKELVRGLEIFKRRECPDLPLAFFTWHDRVEDQHAMHTFTELEKDYFSTDLDEDKFIQGATEMLDGVKSFWDGLNSDRLKRSGERKPEMCCKFVLQKQ
jgi:hypothetical protein